MRMLLLVFAALLASCGSERAEAPAAAENMATLEPAPPSGPGAPLPGPPPPPPPVPHLPGLAPLSEEQVRSELGAGPYCTLSGGGGPLLAARVGDAVVADRGTVVHLRPEAGDWAALSEGGRFESRDLAIEVDAGAVVARDGAMVERDSSVTIVRGGRGFAVSHGPRWACRDRG